MDFVLAFQRQFFFTPMSMVVSETFFGRGKWWVDEEKLEFGDYTFRTDEIGIYSSRWDLEDGFVQLTGQPETAVRFEDVTAQMVLEMSQLKVSPEALLDFLADRLKSPATRSQASATT